jgi:transcriptional regulator with XRE-family HTH domain
MTRGKRRNAIDEFVGARVRERRKSLGMNQSELAQKLALTFQMVQRYEYGLCRISASTLYAIAVALDVPIDYFFDGLPLPSARRGDMSKIPVPSLDLTKTRHGRTLAVLFPRITHRGSQRAIVELVRAIVDTRV